MIQKSEHWSIRWVKKEDCVAKQRLHPWKSPMYSTGLRQARRYLTFSLHCQKYIHAKIMFLPSKKKKKKEYLDQYKWTRKEYSLQWMRYFSLEWVLWLLTMTQVTPTLLKRLQSQLIRMIHAFPGSKQAHPALIRKERS